MLMNPLDHNGSLNRLRSGNRPDRGGSTTAAFVAQQRLIKQVRAAFEGMSEVQRTMFWMHEDFANLSREDRSQEHVTFRLEQSNQLEELIQIWETSNNSPYELVARLLGVRTPLHRRAPGGGPLPGNDDE